VSVVARRLGVDRKTVRRWRERFRLNGVRGLKDRPRSGRPCEIDAVTRCQVVAMACGSPADAGIPHRELWTVDALHDAVLTYQVFGQVRARRSADDLVAFMDAVARRYPCGDVHVVWDNLNTHFDVPDARWTRFNERHGHRFHFHYTPIHASWINQVEIFFSILHKRVLRYSVYPSTNPPAPHRPLGDDSVHRPHAGAHDYTHRDARFPSRSSSIAGPPIRPRFGEACAHGRRPQ